MMIFGRFITGRLGHRGESPPVTAKKGGIGVQTKSVSGAAAVELPANIQDLVMALAGKRRDFEVAQAALETAEFNLRAAKENIAEIRSGIAAQERSVAESNAALPESQSADEVRFALAEKHARILALRRDAARKPCESIRSEIDCLKDEIGAAWTAFGREGYKEALLAYREAAKALSGSLQEVRAWITAFPAIEGRCPEARLVDVGATKPFIDTGDFVWNTEHPADRHPVYLELKKLGAELERAKAEASAIVAQGGGQEEAPTCKA